MLFKKAPKIEEIFTGDLTLTTYCQIAAEDFVNFCGLPRKPEFYKGYPQIFSFQFNMLYFCLSTLMKQEKKNEASKISHCIIAMKNLRNLRASRKLGQMYCTKRYRNKRTHCKKKAATDLVASPQEKCFLQVFITFYFFLSLTKKRIDMKEIC